MRNLFKVDYTNLQEVCELALEIYNEYGWEHVVFKHPDSVYYNIAHASRANRYKKEWVVFTTPPDNAPFPKRR